MGRGADTAVFMGSRSLPQVLERVRRIHDRCFWFRDPRIDTTRREAERDEGRIRMMAGRSKLKEKRSKRGKQGGETHEVGYGSVGLRGAEDGEQGKDKKDGGRGEKKKKEEIIIIKQARGRGY